MIKKINWKIILGFCFIGFCLLWILYYSYKRFELNRNFKITTGQINHITSPGSKNNSRGIDYEYYVGGKILKGENGIKVCDNYSTLDLAHLMVNKKFWVAYDSNDLSSSIIILSKIQANEFDIHVNDTILHYDSLLNCEQIFGDY